MNLPTIVSHDEWLAARKELLVREKEYFRATDALNTDRRQSPMVRIEKAYRFTGPNGEIGLLEMFEGRRQLIVQHFMFDPTWDRGCGSCTAMAAIMNAAVLGQLHTRDTSFAAVSRAEHSKLQAYRSTKGWSFPWYSSFGSGFNFDFQVSLDPSVQPAAYNFRDADELAEGGFGWMIDHVGEQPGVSAFLRDGDAVYRTYSTYGRGVEVMMAGYRLLDITALGRQEDWEVPNGRSAVVRRGDPSYST